MYIMALHTAKCDELSVKDIFGFAVRQTTISSMFEICKQNRRYPVNHVISKSEVAVAM